jgi:hypothetical protein
VLAGVTSLVGGILWALLTLPPGPPATTSHPGALVVQLASPALADNPMSTLIFPSAEATFGTEDSPLSLESHGYTFPLPDRVVLTGVGHQLVSPLPRGGTLVVRGDPAAVAASIRPFPGHEGPPRSPIPIRLADGVGRLPTGPGDYILVIDGYWPAGHAQFDIVVTIARTG